MRAGFVQNLHVKSLTGTYANLNDVLTSAMQNLTYWDTKDRRSYAEKFYSDAPGAFFQNATQTKRSGTISDDDSPGWGPPTERNGNQLSSMTLVWDFRLYVVALTKGNQNAANQVYAPQAQANWTFNGSGNTPGLNWQGVGAGVTPPQTWGAVTDKMIIVGPRFNDTFRNAGWN